MPYPSGHGEKTRARIVETASRLFRKHGYAATGVDRLMGAAGLTRGGFYAYFSSKTKLFIDAVEFAFDEAESNLLGKGLESLRAAPWVSRAARRYVSLEHVNGADTGCVIPSLAAEVSRAEEPVRQAFARRVSRMIERMAERLDGDPNEARRQAVLLLATWVGAIALTRAIDDKELVSEILEICRS